MKRFIILLAAIMFLPTVLNARTLSSKKASCLAIEVKQGDQQTSLGENVSLKEVEFYVDRDRRIEHLRIVGTDKKNDSIYMTWIFHDVNQVKFDRCGDFPGFQFTVSVKDAGDFLPLPETK